MGKELPFPKADVEEAMENAKRIFGLKDDSEVDAATAIAFKECVVTFCRQKRKLEKINEKIKPISKAVALATATMFKTSPIESVMASALASDPVMCGKFQTQYPVGPYTLDFAFPVVRLCVETDGKAYHSSPAQIAHDQDRNGVGWLKASLPPRMDV